MRNCDDSRVESDNRDMFEQIPIGTLFSNVLSELRGQAERTRAGARSLCEATWDYQRAVWLFASAHQHGVARAGRDIAEVESRAVEKLEAASREFTKDYDWPTDLRNAFESEIRKINLETANVKVFSMTGQYDDMEQSAKEVEKACERIRTAARPHTLGFWRRVKELHTVTPAEIGLSFSDTERRWWKTWRGQSILLIVTGVIVGLAVWGVTRHHKKPTPSTAVAQPKTQPETQTAQPEVKPKEIPSPNQAHQQGVREKKSRIEQHGAGSGAVQGGVVQGPCSIVQNGGNLNQANVNCGPPPEPPANVSLCVAPARLVAEQGKKVVQQIITIITDRKVDAPRYGFKFSGPILPTTSVSSPDMATNSGQALHEGNTLFIYQLNQPWYPGLRLNLQVRSASGVELAQEQGLYKETFSRKEEGCNSGLE
jgi:hypothetical protein